MVDEVMERPPTADELDQLFGAVQDSVTPEKPKRGRKPKAPEPPEESAIAWQEFSPYVFNLLLPIYTAHKLELKPSLVNATVLAWGKVADKYLPMIGTYKEEAAAITCTAILVLPLMQAMQKPKGEGPANGNGTGTQPA